MRLALRVLFFELTASWAMVVAGWVHVSVKAWPFVRRSLTARVQRRAWRVGLGLMIATAVIAGWPALFLPAQAEYAGGDWLKIAIPWWVVVGALGAEMLVARLTTDA